jgi:DNA-binding transcriptional LysR family regulator
MELRHLRYFVAVAEERSFTRAAERLWVAQPGLSTQIRRLETELGVRVFDRHSRGVDLTDAGRVLLERARVVLAAAATAAATGDDVRAGLSGTLRLGVSGGPSWSGTSALLRQFTVGRPQLELTLMQGPGGALWRDLRDGRLDALIAPAGFGSPDLRSLALGQERWVVLVAPAHRLSGEGPLPWLALDGQRVAVSGHRDDRPYDRAVAAALEELDVDAEMVPSGPAMEEAVGCGDALLLTTAPPALGAGTCERPLDPPRTVDFALLWRDETPSPALEAFVSAAGEIAAQPNEHPVLQAAA